MELDKDLLEAAEAVFTKKQIEIIAEIVKRKLDDALKEDREAYKSLGEST